jgi:hypothetical protein
VLSSDSGSSGSDPDKGCSVVLSSDSGSSGSSGVDVITSPEAGPNKGCSVVLSSDSGSYGSDPKSNSYAESE